MSKITNRNITDRFIEAFEGDTPFTPSDKRMMGIKLTHLRKSVDAFIKENDIETELSTNEIIMDVIEYSVLSGFKFRSIASLGYQVLPDSIQYWKKRRKIMESMSNQKEENKIDEVIIKSYNEVRNKTNSPKWLNDQKW